MICRNNQRERLRQALTAGLAIDGRVWTFAIVWTMLLSCTLEPWHAKEVQLFFQSHDTPPAMDSAQKSVVVITPDHSWSAREEYGGWIEAGDVAARHREDSDPLYSDFVFGRKGATLRVRPPQGLVEFEVQGGDMVYANKSLAVAIASQPELRLPPIEHLAAGEFARLRWTMVVSSDTVDIALSAPHGGTWVLSSIRMRPAQSPSEPVLTRIRPRPMITPSVWQQAADLPLPPIFVHKTKESPVIAASERLQSAEYLAAIEAIAEEYRHEQAANGRIVDRYEKREIQYSTPAFAWIAALLAHQRSATLWQESSIKALDHCVQALSQRQAPSGHEDFYPILLAHALSYLANSDQAKVQKDKLAQTDPWALYTTPPGLGNWNVAALAGEYHLFRLGLRRDLAFVEASLARQSKHMNNPFGHYLSEENAVAYDILPRVWLGDLLQAGYDRSDADALAKVWDRAAWSTLLVLSPRGEALSGGRSSLYVWNDAALCALFEIAAARALARGEAEKAGYYHAGAHLAFRSVLAWFNRDGSLAIVKNHFPATSRHGLEPYAHAANYNLLTAALLALAYEHFDPSTLERPAPSQVDGLVLDMSQTLGKIAANHRGTAIEINLRRHDSNDPIGLVRVDWQQVDRRLMVPAGLLEKAPYHLPKRSSATLPLNTGVSVQWRSPAGIWRNLTDAQANDTAEHAPLAVDEVQMKDDRINFQIHYRELQDDADVFEVYELNENSVRITTRVDAPESQKIRMIAPIMVDDGESKLSVVHDADGCVEILAPSSSSATHRRAYWCTNAPPLDLLPEKLPYRSGWAQLLTTQERDATQAIWLEVRVEDRL